MISTSKEKKKEKWYLVGPSKIASTGNSSANSHTAPPIPKD
jgi:hypothetical protein